MCRSATPCRLPNAFVADPPLEQVITRSLETGIRGQSNFNKFTVNLTSTAFYQKIMMILFLQVRVQVYHLVTLKLLRNSKTRYRSYYRCF